MPNIVLIFAGGVGNRMHSSKPKQFLEVNGKPIIIMTIEQFEINNNIDEIYVACVEDYIDELNGMIDKFNVKKIKRVFPGGESGQDTIYKGLVEIGKDYGNACVLIHDGVRPLVSQDTIDKCVRDVNEYGSAVTVTPAFETPLISLDGDNVDAMPLRKNVYTAQAPQCFMLKDILEWHFKERRKEEPYNGIVDSCGLAFSNGFRAHLTEGNRGNIKVTTVDDYLTLISNSNVNNYEQLFELVKNDPEKQKVLVKKNEK